jgi:hypothetical protein
MPKKEKTDELLVESFIENNFEESFANCLSQISNFIDQMIIETSSESNKESTLKNLVNLKSFIDKSTFEYQVKRFLLEKIDNKKKQSLEKEELKNQKDQ